MSKHELFEELCALAALAKLTLEETAELNAHLAECESCREAYYQFSQIAQRGLPLVDPRTESWLRIPAWAAKSSNYRKRFIERARAEGIQLSGEAENAKSSWGIPPFLLPRPNYVAAVVILVLMATGVLAFQLRQRGGLQHSRELGELKREVSDLSRTRNLLEAKLVGETTARKRLEGELSRSLDARGATLARVSHLQEQFQRAMANARNLRADLDRAGKTTSELAGKLREEEQRLAELGEEIGKLRSAQSLDAATIAAQQYRLNELSEEVAVKNDMLERDRQLLAAGRDIRDLMGARNLHIIDVYDVDGRGKDRRSFGRVFYTEGKSLIFYAFDLADPTQLKAKHSFQAWGEREGATAPARSLGIFYVDDVAQKRWVLKVENPEILRQIDAVFVTIEPFGGEKKPTGQKLLYAYLGNPANHP